MLCMLEAVVVLLTVKEQVHQAQQVGQVVKCIMDKVDLVAADLEIMLLILVLTLQSVQLGQALLM